MSNDRDTQSLLTAFASALPVFASALLVASVAYDYAFLLALGLTLDDIPSSLTEHARSAVTWAPRVLITFILYAVVELYLQRVEGGQTEDEIVASSPAPGFTRALRRSGDVAVWVFAICTAVLGPFLSTDRGWVFFSFMVLWGTLTFSILSHPRMGRKFDSLSKRSLLVVPILLSMVCIHGHSGGTSLIKGKEARWDALIKIGEVTKPYQLLGVRRFTSFAVAVTHERRILVLPNDSILSVQSIEPEDVTTPNSCRWFNVLCN